MRNLKLKNHFALQSRSLSGLKACAVDSDSRTIYGINGEKELVAIDTINSVVIKIQGEIN